MTIERIPDDFGPESCPLRERCPDPTMFFCGSNDPRVRVNRDGTVLKRLCRICELFKKTGAKSDGLLKKYFMNDGERKQEKKIEYRKKIEQIKIEALKEHQRLKQRDSKAQIDWGNSEAGPDPFAMPEEY